MSYQTIQLKDVATSLQVSLPIVLTIAGSDPSGGAGIEADLKTFSAHEVFGATCITALTAQNTQKVKSVTKTNESCLSDILQSIFEDYLDKPTGNPLKIIKTGMLTKEAVCTLSPYLHDLHSKDVRIVVDPVMVSTSGATLFREEDALDSMLTLLRNVYLVTPNFLEALTLSGVVKDNNEVKFDSLQEMIDFVKELQKQLGCRNILVKGGHHPWVKSLWKKATEKDFANEMNIVVTDILYEHQYDKVTVFESSFVKTMNSHGTGCTLSSAIAANLAKGSTLSDSIILSIDFIHKSMDSMVKLGHGNGPLNHVTYKPESISSKVIQGNNEACATIDSLFLFLKTHPKIIEKWKRYTEHPFVKKVATNQLPYDQFIYFLKQDYFYLINYAQIYCLAAAKSPTYQVTLTNARVVENVVNEIERHKAKLKTKYNIEYDGNTDIQPGPACIAYCEYLLEAGRNEDYLGIKVALAPCLFGYHEAGLYGKSIQIEHKTTTFGKNSKGYIGSLSSMDEVEVYDSWLNDYVLDWYTSSYNQGEFDLNKTFKDTLVSKERIEQLVNSFVKVTELEISFWDEVLQQ